MNFMDPICVSVIIPAYNASSTIGKALDALSRQKCFQPFEVIVVDDGSTDNTGEILRVFNKMGTVPFRIIRQDNAGPAAARNHGASLAQGEYLAFTDSDCIPHEDWISTLMAGFSQSHVGVVAGSYGIANPESRLARCICEEILWRHAHLMPKFPNSFGSYNFCVKKNVFDAVGGFNPEYRHASGEDNDLSYKITRSGWRIYFERKALVDHHHPTRVDKYLKEQFRHGFWRVRMYRDHPRMIRGDGYTYWKDMIEVPWAGCILVSLLVSALNHLGFVSIGCFILLSLLIFEIISAFIMTHCFFGGIFFGLVLFFRAFARTLGFSTGILSLWRKKIKKIF